MLAAPARPGTEAQLPLPGPSSAGYAGGVTADLARLNRELAEHRKYVSAGAAVVAYSLALFGFGMAAASKLYLGILLIALAATFFLFGVIAALLHAAHAACLSRRIRTLTHLPTARVIRAPVDTTARTAHVRHPTAR